MIRSAYLHVPFCVHRCGYCNFTVVANRRDLVDDFLDALELEMQRLLAHPCEVDTLFWGGGTPTYLNPAQLDRLIQMCQHWLPLAKGGEWTCEANPRDCRSETLERLRAGGINRLSVGGQSFSDDKLRLLERDHRGQELRDVLGRARELFPAMAVDLIFAVPGETIGRWLHDLHSVCRLRVDHVSTYGLTIEKGSAFFGRQLRGQLQTLPEELELDMYRTAIRELTSAGFEHYEVSNFAKPGRACRHNEAYWLGQPWWAFGPGAAAFDGRTRTVNHRSLSTYLRRVQHGQSPVDEREELSDEQQLRERFVFGLRRLAGIDFQQLATTQFPEPEGLFQPHLDRAVAAGWLSRQGSHVKLTQAGLVISDSLWPHFL